MQWAERDILGLERYGRQAKNRQLFFATDYGFMAAGGEGSYCHYNSLGGIMAPDAAKFDFWGVGHEWGHNNQIPEGFHWSGCGEMSNNIYASWAQIHFTGHRNAAGKVTYLRLEDENSGIDEYSSTRGGRMQTYFEEGLRKGVSWQLQDGPDYHNATPETKNVVGYDATGKYIGMVNTTSRNYDHFVKLVPFWQLNLWGTLAGKCPDIIPMVIESIRTTENYSSTYNTHGKKQVNWVKIACDSTKLDLLPFFEKAGILRPISAYIEDYSPGWIIIDDNMITELKNYVKEQGYPAYTEEINYINGHNYHIYRDNLKLETPEKMGEGCTLSGNRVKVMHDVVRNAVAFETCNSYGDVLRITMYGLASNDEHSFTQVLYPTGSTIYDTPAYIVAVGYDGTRKKIYEAAENIPLTILKKKLTQVKGVLASVDPEGVKVGYYKPEKLANLQALFDAAQAAVDSGDASVEAYAEWIELIDAEIAALEADQYSRVPVFELSHYAMVNKNYSRTALTHVSAGLKVATSLTPAENSDLHWQFVSAGEEGLYYIQHVVSGMYISVANDGARVKAEATATSEAVAFRLVNASNGFMAIQNSSSNVYLACDASKNVVGSKDMAGQNSQWTITLVADNHTEAIKTKLDKMLGMVDNTLAELLATTEPALEFNSNIIVLDEQLPLYVEELIAVNDLVIKKRDEGYVYLDELYALLKEAYDKVKAAYQKELSLPEATTGDEVECYYLYCLKNDFYAYHYEGTGRYNGAIRTGELTDESDYNFWFYLRPGNVDGEYYIYNWKTQHAVGVDGRYLYVDGSKEAVAYTISISEDGKGFIISEGDGTWGVQSASTAYAQFSSSASAQWNLIPVGRFSITGIAPVTTVVTDGVYYDLLGRPVVNPAAGIYIHNGRKIIVK